MRLPVSRYRVDQLPLLVLVLMLRLVVLVLVLVGCILRAKQSGMALVRHASGLLIPQSLGSRWLLAQFENACVIGNVGGAVARVVRCAAT